MLVVLLYEQPVRRREGWTPGILEERWNRVRCGIFEEGGDCLDYIRVDEKYVLAILFVWVV